MRGHLFAPANLFRSTNQHVGLTESWLGHTLFKPDRSSVSGRSGIESKNRAVLYAQECTAVLASGEYERAWADLRRRDRLIRLVALSSLPGLAILILFTCTIYGDVPEHFGRWVGGSWLAAFFSACVYRRRFRCPRCRYHFFERISFHSGSTCGRCSLPLWGNSGLTTPAMW